MLELLWIKLKGTCSVFLRLWFGRSLEPRFTPLHYE
jgi:hypothetical protein